MYTRLAIVVLIAQLEQVPTIISILEYHSLPADHGALDRRMRPITNVLIQPSTPPLISFVVGLQAVVALAAYALALCLGIASIRAVKEDGTGISPKTRLLLRQFTWSLGIKVGVRMAKGR